MSAEEEEEEEEEEEDATEGPRAPAVKPGLRKLVREGRVEPVQRV